jgi:hypothetical protein
MLQPHLTGVTALPDYRLLLNYETGESKIFDVTPYIDGDWYGHLRDVNYFASVRVLPDNTGIEWPEGQDIAPHELYDLSI